MSCTRKFSCNIRDQTIRRHHIKSAAWQQHDARAFRFFIHRRQRFEAFDLAADIHIMPFCADARLRHLTKGQHERTRAMQDRIHFEQCRVKRGSYLRLKKRDIPNQIFRLVRAAVFHHVPQAVASIPLSPPAQRSNFPCNHTSHKSENFS